MEGWRGGLDWSSGRIGAHPPRAVLAGARRGTKTGGMLEHEAPAKRKRRKMERWREGGVEKKKSSSGIFPRYLAGTPFRGHP